jgi:hypothetical protein
MRQPLLSRSFHPHSPTAKGLTTHEQGPYSRAQTPQATEIQPCSAQQAGQEGVGIQALTP